MKNWRYFMGAAILGGFFLLNAGAPPFAVLTGIAFGAFMTFRAARAA